MTKYEYLRKLV